MNILLLYVHNNKLGLLVRNLRCQSADCYNFRLEHSQQLVYGGLWTKVGGYNLGATRKLCFPSVVNFCTKTNFFSLANMHQTKIGNFFKKIPAPNANSPAKSDTVEKNKLDVENKSLPEKNTKTKVTPSPVKSAFDKLIIEKNGEAKPKAKSTYGSKKSKAEATKDCNVVLKRIPSNGNISDQESANQKSVDKPKVKSTTKPGMKRKSKEESSEEDDPVEKSNRKSSKKARRRIVVESSSSESDDARESESEETAEPVKRPESPKKSKIVTSKTEQKKGKKESKTPQKSPKVKPTGIAKPKSPEKEAKQNEDKTSPKAEIDKKPNKIHEEKVDKPSPFTLSPKKNAGAGNPLKGWNPNYSPTKASSKYDPVEDATWEHGQKVPYLALAKTLEAIEETSSRLKIIETLANYFRSVIVLSPDDLIHSVYLCLNKLAPAYEGVELGIAETNIMKAIAQATGRTLQHVKADAATKGDLGLVAESSRSNQSTLIKPLPLSVDHVFHKLKDIAGMTGHAVQQKKIGMIQHMLVSCKYSEARYLTRSLAGKLRIGLAEQSLLQALAQACYLTPPNQDVSVWPPKILNAGNKMSAETLKSKIEEQAFILKSSYCECPSYEILVDALVKEGFGGLHKYCKLTPGIPPRPMLAQPTKGVSDVLQRFDGIKFTSEYKYDGERAQIHLLEDGSVNIFSRNQENNTSKYPDIISRFSGWNKGNAKSCILDTEAVAWDQEKECILPFQVLSTRKRKDANEAEIKVQVFIFAFDLIYLNGVNLIKEPLIKRRELLRENFGEVHGQFGFATSLDTDSMEEVQEFLEESIKGNCEGLMVKTLDVNASYELAKRSQKWLKLKKDYLDSGGDSLDLVVIGGFLGKGKRTGTYGGFLLACYDPDNEEFQSICKLGTGFSDEQLVQHSESLKPHIIKSAKPYYRCNSQLTPDHWFDAVQVWEVKCADLSLSPVHTAGAGLIDPQRGISLRFPRFLKIRDDKNVEDATSSSQVADMYKNQDQVKNADTKKDAFEDEDDFY